MRDSSTASNVLVLVSINQLQRVYDTHRLVSLQKIYRVEPSFSLNVNEVPEVPAHEVVDFQNGAGGHMASVVSVFWSQNRTFNIFCGKLFHFIGHDNKVSGFESVVEKISHAIRGSGEFFQRND